MSPVLAQQVEVSRTPGGVTIVGAAASSAQAAGPQPATAQSTSGTVSSMQSATAAAAATPAASGVVAGDVQRVRDLLTQKFGLARAKAEQISAAVMSSASKYSLPPALVLAIISIESRFQEHARGAHGATGLMQVVPAAHKRLVKNLDLTEPAANIEAGSAILHGYIESARGDVSAALKSYGGSTAYARKVSLRTKDFQAVDDDDAAAKPSSP
jgi:soluble lytic murein transglycosylase-like protein